MRSAPCGRIACSTGSWDVEVFADFDGKKLIDLAITRHCRALACGSIGIYRMRTTLAEERTAMLLEVTNKVGALHAESGKGSLARSMRRDDLPTAALHVLRIDRSPAHARAISVKFASAVARAASARVPLVGG
jgi:hypothetical protein